LKASYDAMFSLRYAMFRLHMRAMRDIFFAFQFSSLLIRFDGFSFSLR